jgi:hypothetical protein
MIYNRSNDTVPAPCLIDSGILVNKQDIIRLLSDLTHVQYIHWQDGEIKSQGEGYILDVFADPQRSTLIANHAVYINVHSFDYLELKQSADSEAYFDLVQEGLMLRLTPLSNPLKQERTRVEDNLDLETMVAELLTAKLDAEQDDDGFLPF